MANFLHVLKFSNSISFLLPKLLTPHHDLPQKMEQLQLKCGEKLQKHHVTEASERIISNKRLGMKADIKAGE